MKTSYIVGENVRDQEEAACRLLHLITIEENILDIHVEKCLCREAATTVIKYAYRGEMSNRSKSLLIINPIFVCEPFAHRMFLIQLK